ncbi:hypothetical protein E1189_05290 [Sansalvadorimonas verongulae]|nr:hypothetical protein [Sansalvadorimonas verongulae]
MKKANELSKDYCQHGPDEEALRKRLFVISHKYSELIKDVFADYVYQTAHVNGGGITVCWLDAHDGLSIPQIRHHIPQIGHHVPQSTAELNALIKVTSYSQWDIYGHYLRTAFRSHNALVLDDDDLTTIAQEFVNGLELDTGSITEP